MIGLLVFLMLHASQAQHFLFPEDYVFLERSSLDDTTPCVPLKRCKSLLRLWNSRYVRQSTAEAIKALEDAHCGFSGGSTIPLFRCPEEIKANGRKMVIADRTRSMNDACAGTLKLFVGGDPEPDVVTRENIEKLNVKASRVVVTGNCCWRLYTAKHFHGRSLSVRFDSVHNNVGIVKSLRKIPEAECPKFS